MFKIKEIKKISKEKDNYEWKLYYSFLRYTLFLYVVASLWWWRRQDPPLNLEELNYLVVMIVGWLLFWLDEHHRMHNLHLDDCIKFLAYWIVLEVVSWKNDSGIAKKKVESYYWQTWHCIESWSRIFWYTRF